MTCSKCKTKNEDIAQFCKRCGMNLYAMKQGANSKKSDTLILSFIIFMLAMQVVRFLIEKLIPNWYEPPTQYILVLLSVVSGFAFILLALAIKKETTRTTGIILAVIYAFYIIFLNATWLIGIG